MAAVKSGRAVLWANPSSPRRNAVVVIVGVGRMGGALAFGLSRAGWPIFVVPGNGQSRQTAKRLGLRLADQPTLARARICILAVPDTALRRVAEEISVQLGAQAALVHCAGALTLAGFGNNRSVQRRSRGSFHPLCAVSDPRDDLSGHAVALSASNPFLERRLREMAADLGLKPFHVPESGRTAYHAAAAMAAGGLVSLAFSAVSILARAGVPKNRARIALLPLMRSAIRGIEQRGLAGALTGPIARGDLEVVDAHLKALPLANRALYLALARESLRLARLKLPPKTTAALKRALLKRRKPLKRSK